MASMSTGNVCSGGAGAGSVKKVVGITGTTSTANSSVCNTPTGTPVTNGGTGQAAAAAAAVLGHCMQSTPPPTQIHQQALTANAPKYGTLVPNRIFVGGIAANTTEGELMQLFSNYGTVKAAKIIQDRAGVSKGYGFITFESEDDAKRPLRDADNIVLRERKLNIAPAIKKQTFYVVQPFGRAFDAASPPGGMSAAAAAAAAAAAVAAAAGGGASPAQYFYPAAAAAAGLPYFQGGMAYFAQPAPPHAPSATAHGAGAGPPHPGAAGAPPTAADGSLPAAAAAAAAAAVYQGQPGAASLYPGQAGGPPQGPTPYPASVMFPQFYMPQQFPIPIPYEYNYYTTPSIPAYYSSPPSAGLGSSLNSTNNAGATPPPSSSSGILTGSSSALSSSSTSSSTSSLCQQQPTNNDSGVACPGSSSSSSTVGNNLVISRNDGGVTMTPSASPPQNFHTPTTTNQQSQNNGSTGGATSNNNGPTISLQTQPQAQQHHHHHLIHHPATTTCFSDFGAPPQHMVNGHHPSHITTAIHNPSLTSGTNACYNYSPTTATMDSSGTVYYTSNWPYYGPSMDANVASAGSALVNGMGGVPNMVAPTIVTVDDLMLSGYSTDYYPAYYMDPSMPSSMMSTTQPPPIYYSTSLPQSAVPTPGMIPMTLSADEYSDISSTVMGAPGVMLSSESNNTAVLNSVTSTLTDSSRQTKTPVVSLLSMDQHMEKDFWAMQAGRRVGGGVASVKACNQQHSGSSTAPAPHSGRNGSNSYQQPYSVHGGGGQHTTYNHYNGYGPGHSHMSTVPAANYGGGMTAGAPNSSMNTATTPFTSNNNSNFRYSNASKNGSGRESLNNWKRNSNSVTGTNNNNRVGGLNNQGTTTYHNSNRQQPHSRNTTAYSSTAQCSHIEKTLQSHDTNHSSSTNDANNCLGKPVKDSHSIYERSYSQVALNTTGNGGTSRSVATYTTTAMSGNASYQPGYSAIRSKSRNINCSSGISSIATPTPSGSENSIPVSNRHNRRLNTENCNISNSGGGVNHDNCNSITIKRSTGEIGAGDGPLNIHTSNRLDDVTQDTSVIVDGASSSESCKTDEVTDAVLDRQMVVFCSSDKETNNCKDTGQHSIITLTAMATGGSELQSNLPDITKPMETLKI